MTRSPTTRMALLELRARRAVAARGARLLRAKREVLAGELWKLLAEVVEGRSRLDAALREAVKARGLAEALEGAPWLESLALAAGREIPVQVSVRRVWGVATPGLQAPPLQRAADQRGSDVGGYGLAAAEAARAHEEALEVLLGIATRELHLARLGDEIQATSRRINALEQRVLPALGGEAGRIAAALEERDREDAVRLKRFRAGRARRAAAAGAPARRGG